MRDVIDHFDDPRLDDYRNISDADLLRSRGAFIAEGRLVVARLLESSRFATRSLMLTAAARTAMTGALAAHPDIPLYEVSQETMNHVTGFNLHRGCLAIGERRPMEAPVDVLRGATHVVALERVGNADNVGSIFRHAAAFGASAVLLDEASADPLYRKALRTSMGAALTVPFARSEQWLPTLAACREDGHRLVALTPASHATPLAEVLRSLAGARLVLVLGHEGDGLRESTIAACDVAARIPIRASVDSLNVATAAAIALYEVSKAQR